MVFYKSGAGHIENEAELLVILRRQLFHETTVGLLLLGADGRDMLTSGEGVALGQRRQSRQHVAQARLEGPKIEVRSHPDDLDGKPVGFFPYGQGFSSSHGADEDGVYVSFGQPLSSRENPGIECHHPSG